MRPKIAHAMRVVITFASNPRKQHWEAVKWILGYLQAMSNLSLCFGQGDMVVRGYVDVDFANDHEAKYHGTYLYFGFNNNELSLTSAKDIDCPRQKLSMKPWRRLLRR